MSYWSDERQRNGENQPSPSGLWRKSGAPGDRSSSVGVEIRPYFVFALDNGVAAAIGLGLVWPNFRSQRHPSQ
jgi:hypothetical protein